MTTEKRDFNTEAASWDEKPARVKLAADLFDAVRGVMAFSPETRLLDFGCGAGLLTLQLAPLVGSATGMDTSWGMLEVFEKKAAAQGHSNVRAVGLDPNAAPTVVGEFDCVISTMALHHVEHVPPLLKQFHACLAPGGMLGIADLDLDGGLFHDDHSSVFHHGFDRDALQRQFEQAGFGDVRHTTAAELEREGADGQVRRFTIFLMTGCRM